MFPPEGTCWYLPGRDIFWGEPIWGGQFGLLRLWYTEAPKSGQSDQLWLGTNRTVTFWNISFPLTYANQGHFWLWCRASGERGNAWLKLREEWRAEGNSSNRYDRERNRPSPALAYSPASSVNFSDAPNLPNGARMTDWFLGVSVHSLRGAFETYSISDRKGPRGRRGSTKFPVFADTYNSDKRGRGRVKEIHKFCRLHIILIQINLLLFF